jgi:hypothetical protein
MTAEPQPLPPPGRRDVPAWAPRLQTGDELAPEDQSRRDMTLYPQLISDGITTAERRGSPVDHLTARRMSLMLLSQSQDPQLSRGLARFATDGTVTQKLCQSLRQYVRRPGHPHQAQSWTLLEYAASRGTDLGPVGTDFAAACDQADEADETRILAPSDRSSGNAAKAREATQPTYPPRRGRPVYAYVLWASDWAKEQNPSNRANLYDALRAGTDPARTIPYAPGHYSQAILTPDDWAQIQAEDLEDIWEPWDLHDWERDHEIE